MSAWQIKTWEDGYLAEMIEVWRRVFANRKHDFKVDEGSFRSKVLESPCFDPDGALLALAGNRVVGFALAVAPGEEAHGT